ncbi:MAG: hypothetical protein IJI07_02110 [Flexilinea sp.]|nr:hypothetical protein [Flexilinea sp.]
MLRIPGFIDIGTDISGGSWRSVSAAALKGGYTSLLAAPVSEKVYTEKADVLLALDEPSRTAACDYAKLALITPENIRTVGEWADEVPAALLDFSIIEQAGGFVQMNLLSRMFNRWPAERPICVRGNENQIGSAIFMAQVHSRKVHICSVTTRGEIEMISEAKRDGLSVTCDIHPLSLLFSCEPGSTSGMLKHLGDEEDRLALWQHFSEIDCFSSAGYISPRGNPGDALTVMMPLLFSMRNAEMLTDEDILLRCCLNPAKIFGVRLDRETVIEVDETEVVSGHDAHSGIRVVKLHGRAYEPGDAVNAERPVLASRIKGFSA